MKITIAKYVPDLYLHYMLLYYYFPQNNDIPSVKMLTVFGANVNAVNSDNQTPLGLTKSKATRFFLKKMNSWTGVSVEESSDFGFTLVPHAPPPSMLGAIGEAVDTETILTHGNAVDSSMESSSSLTKNYGEVSQSLVREEVESELAQLLRSVEGSVSSDKIYPNVAHLPQKHVLYEDNSSARKLYMQLDVALKKQTDNLNSISSQDEIVACYKQRKELAKFKKTGNRILCLDGGGMKALVELDILCSIEKHTGKKITELFDWIVGTSTGGILALGLVYGEVLLKHL